MSNPIANCAGWAGWLLFAVGLLPTAGHGAGQDASAYLRRASAAMGAGDINALRYVASGSGNISGQSNSAGGPGAKIKILSQTRSVDYANSSISDENVRTTAENPFRAGGGVPNVGEQRQMLLSSGAYAWNQVGPLSVPAPLAVADRQHQLWTTPHGVVKAAQRNNATVDWVTRGGRSLAAVSFTEPGRFSATAFFNDAGILERVESRVAHPVLGDQRVDTEYSDYRDFGGVKFPARIRQTQGGGGALELAVSEVRAVPSIGIKVPEIVAKNQIEVRAEKAAEGVWYLAGGSHHSVLIEMKDHLVVVEGPQFDGRSVAVIAEAKKLVPGKPVRYVVNTHYHFDHSGGLRAFAAEGATIVTHAANKPFFERAYAGARKLAPDLLAQSGKKAKFLAVGEKKVMGDGARSFEIHALKGNPHAEGFIMVYLPKERLLIEVDAFTPPPPNMPPPAKPTPFAVNLLDNIERLGLAVDRILPLHGRIVPFGELRKFVGRSS